MKEKCETKTLSFLPIATTSDLHQFAYRLGYDSESLWLAVSQHKDAGGVTVGDRLNQWLTTAYKRTNTGNSDWAEARLEISRLVHYDWSIDGMVVDGEGQVVGASVWSTYNAFKRNAELKFTLRDIVNYIQKSGQMVYPLSPKYDTVLFALDKDEERVRAAVERNTGNFKVEDYATSGIKIIRVMQGKKGTMGTGQFAREGITVGKLGFWESPRLALGEFGDGTYVQRVVF